MNLLEKLASALRTEKPCGCPSPKHFKNVNKEVTVRNLTLDVVKDSERFIGEIPYWDNTKIVKGLKTIREEPKGNYDEITEKIFMYYLCIDCGDSFKIQLGEKERIRPVPEEIDPRLNDQKESLDQVLDSEEFDEVEEVVDSSSNRGSESSESGSGSGPEQSILDSDDLQGL